MAEQIAAWLTSHPVEVISFDAMGTLIVPGSSIGEIYAEELAGNGLGYTVSAELLEQRFRDAFAAFREESRDGMLNRAGWRTIVAATLQGITPQESFDRQFQAIWDSFARPQRWRVLPGVLETLDVLQRAGFRLIVLSNNDERLRSVLEGLRLAHYFEEIFLSTDFSVEKPDRRIFQAVQRRVQVEPERILHAGDSLVEDIAGALQAGWNAVWVGERSFDLRSGRDHSQMLEEAEAAGRFRRGADIRMLLQSSPSADGILKQDE